MKYKSSSVLNVVVLSLFFLLLVTAGTDAAPQYNLACNACHGMPPLDSAIRDRQTGAFKGNHQTHQPVGAKITNCAVCHSASDYTTGHLNNKINFQANLNNSPAVGQYLVSGSAIIFKNQTSMPNLGTCSNVNCHFETVSPQWGGTKFAYNSPTDNDCNKCHGAPPAGVAPGFAGGAAGSHGMHNLYYTGASQCRKCHSDHLAEASKFAHASSAGNRPLLISLHDPLGRPGGSYNGPLEDFLPSQSNTFGSCTNLYCHSTVQGAGGSGVPVYGTPVWGASQFCSTCHREGPHLGVAADGSNEPINSGSHTRHLAYALGVGGSEALKCVICHKWDTTKAMNDCNQCHASPERFSKHVNGTVDVIFEPYFGNGTYTGTGTPGDGYGACSATYCHSNGTSVATGTIPVNIAPQWGVAGPLACNSCHGFPPAYSNNTPKKNSHVKHVYACNYCHSTTTADGTTIASTYYHVNKLFDVSPGGGTSFVYTFNSGGGSCANISCHGGNSAAWGGTVGCQDCHGGASDAESFAPLSGTPFWNNGTPTNVKMSGEWDVTGHGKVAGTYTSGNSAAGFTGAQACEYCHDSTVTHNVNSNPFRLRNQNDATWGKNGVCMNCHKLGSTGVSVGGILKNGTRKVGSMHHGVKHTGNNGGQWCWDCHDGHGDTNIFMIHGQVAKDSESTIGAPTSLVTATFTAFSTGTDYAGSATKICNTCHTITNHYTSTSSDRHHAGGRCTNCHRHTGNSLDDAFKVPGGP